MERDVTIIFSLKEIFVKYGLSDSDSKSHCLLELKGQRPSSVSERKGAITNNILLVLCLMFSKRE